MATFAEICTLPSVREMAAGKESLKLTVLPALKFAWVTAHARTLD